VFHHREPGGRPATHGGPALDGHPGLPIAADAQPGAAPGLAWPPNTRPGFHGAPSAGSR
jgi:hypothetical protein